MFKKLKDKLAEEVKQPAQRFQQMAAAAQTAISSASSSTSDTATDNFFSITEEDTPQNSPARKPPITSPIVNKTSTPNVTANNNGISVPSVSLTRTRKLSNSSMASDVSFRLPQFDSPAVYHLQSDLDTASEMEDSQISQQLDMVSKEQLHSAYKKALDRYQKYRGRYTEVARRYRDLERDNNKARGVLVETQDKALRRISELREQCTLEQQAKAHLEAALRLEMDEMQCVVKTLKTKLELSGRNNDATENGNHESLINFDSEADANNGNVDDRIKTLEDLLAKEKLTFKALTDDNESLQQKVKELQAREEENSILMAENKMMIHSELEQKENEVKGLRHEKEQLQNLSASLVAQLKGAEVKNVAADEQIKELETIMNIANEEKRQIESKFVLFEKKILELETSNKTVASEKASLQQKLNENAEKFKVAEAERSNKSEADAKIEKLTQELNQLTTQLRSLEGERTSAKEEIEQLKQTTAAYLAKCEQLESEKVQFQVELKTTMDIIQTFEISTKQLQDQLKKTETDRKSVEDALNKKLEKSQKKLKSATEEKTALKSENDASKVDVKAAKQEINKLQQQTSALTEELKNTKIVNENSESEAIKNLQESMKASISAVEQKLLATEQELCEVIEGKEVTIKQLTDENGLLQERLENVAKDKEDGDQKLTGRIEELVDQLKQMDNEKQDNVAENTVFKAKIDNLKAEKRDLEKTLEREIREKSELKTQVTNILQEIGRLEDQLKEVKLSHSLIQAEKQTLEEKIEKIQKQHTDAKNKLEKEASNKWQVKTKELEAKLQAIEGDTARLTDRSCLLEETNQRLLKEHSEAETKFKQEKTELNLKLQELENLVTGVDELNNQLAESEKKAKSIADQLTQCTGDHAKLFNEKELLDHQLRTLQDDCETKEKEKLCLLDNNKCLEDKLKDIEHQKQQLEVTTADLRENLETIRQENIALTAAKTEIGTELEAVRTKVTDLEKTKDYLDAKVVKLREKVTHFEAENAKLNSKSHTRLRELEDALKHTNDEKQKLNESLNKNATDIEKKLQNYEEIKIENEYLNTLTKQLESDAQQAKDETAAIAEELKALREKSDKDMGELKMRLQQSENLLEGKDGEIRKLINDFVESENELKRQLTALQTERKDLNIQLEGNRIIIKDLNGDMEKFQQEAAASKKGVETKMAEHEAARLRIKELEVELQERTVNVTTQNDLEASKRDFMATELQQLKSDKDDLNKQNEVLNEKLTALQTSYDSLTQDNQSSSSRLELTELKAKIEEMNGKNQEITLENETLREKLKGMEETSAAGKPQTEQDSAADHENKELKDQLKKIMHEVHDVSNRNQFLEQQCENFLILEQSNERLKLANEKLSRQLDETLVSLHHTEGMAVNTEFEYLRNILFQYLTDSVNSNSTTLVKVIAAVLKFSPQQTQVVLEKEAQRHSLLGSLNKLL